MCACVLSMFDTDYIRNVFVILKTCLAHFIFHILLHYAPYFITEKQIKKNIIMIMSTDYKVINFPFFVITEFAFTLHLIFRSLDTFLLWR